MKTINHFLESFAIAVILAVSSYIVVTKGTILWLQALTLVALLILVIVYTKLSINHEKHLEAKFEMIHLSYTNCQNYFNDLRKRYNEVEKQRDEWKEKYEKLDFERRYEEKIPDNTSAGDIMENTVPDETSGEVKVEGSLSNINDPDITLPFAEHVPYIGQMVQVTYGGKKVETQITKILDEGENGLRYRCYKCGSKKYKAEDMVAIGDIL